MQLMKKIVEENRVGTGYASEAAAYPGLHTMEAVQAV